MKRPPLVERPRHYEEPFSFSDAQERELLELLAGERPGESDRLFVVNAALTIRLYRNIRIEEAAQPTGADVRAELAKLARDLNNVVSRLDGEGMSRHADRKLVAAIFPELTFFFRDYFRDARWYRKLPPEYRYRGVLLRALSRISKRIEQASWPSQQEKKGGRIPRTAKRDFVAQIVRDYYSCYGRIPPTTKDARFEWAVEFLLETADFEPGKVSELIRQSVRIVKAQLPPKTA